MEESCIPVVSPGVYLWIADLYDRRREELEAMIREIRERDPILANEIGWLNSDSKAEAERSLIRAGCGMVYLSLEEQLKRDNKTRIVQKRLPILASGMVEEFNALIRCNSPELGQRVAKIVETDPFICQVILARTYESRNEKEIYRVGHAPSFIYLMLNDQKDMDVLEGIGSLKSWLEGV